MAIDKIINAPTPNEQINKINEIIDNLGGGGTATDVQINGTSITSKNVANIVTNTNYDSTTNKIATMSDVSGKVNYSDSIQIIDNRGSTSATHFYTYSTMNNALDFLQNEIESLNGDLNNKLNNTTPHIIDTIHTNGAGYRIYSDGWCEQWGTISPVSSSTSDKQVTFYKEFEDTDYTFFGHSHYSESVIPSTSNVAYNTARSYSVVTGENNAKTTKSINISYINSKWKTYWFAMGYLKTGEY